MHFLVNIVGQIQKKFKVQTNFSLKKLQLEETYYVSAIRNAISKIF